MEQCNRCLYDTTIKSVTIGSSGQCNMCDIHDSLEKHSAMHDWNKELDKIKNQKRKYHCLIGISGGFDSSMMLMWAIKQGLNPLVIHFDNGWNEESADANISLLVRHFRVDFLRLRIDKKEYNDLCKAFLWASVPDADIPNDMAMAAMMARTAYKYGIKYILNGHNFRTEGSSPISWSYMDAKYVESVYFTHTEEHDQLKHFPLLGFWEQLYHSLWGLTQVRPLYYLKPDVDQWKQELTAIGWREYGAKHAENIYTNFIGSYYLPKKFGINKALTYHSALIRSGKMLKADFHLPLPDPTFPEFRIRQILHELGITEQEFKIIMAAPQATFNEYETYHKMFRRWKPVLWIFMRMRLIPYTFFKKYTA